MTLDVNQILVGVVGTLLAGFIAWVCKYLIFAYQNKRKKFLFYYKKSYLLPDDPNKPNENSYLCLLAIWNPTTSAILASDITQPIKISAKNVSYKVLVVTDGRMSSAISRGADDKIFFSPDTVPPHAGLVLALSPLWMDWLNLEGQINNTNLIEWSKKYPPDFYKVYHLIDGAVFAILFFLAMFSGFLLKGYMGGYEYVAPPLLIILLFRYFPDLATRAIIKNLAMPEPMKKLFEAP